MFDSKSLRKLENHTYRNCQLKILSLLDRHENQKEIRILDVGCGDGKFSKEVGKKVNSDQIFGMELDPKLIKKAKKNKIKIFKGDANKRFPFKDNFFDIVISNQLAEHLINPDNLFKEIKRILKPNGYSLIATPNLNSFHNRLFVLAGWQITNISPSTEKVFGNPNRGAKSHMNGPLRHMTVFSPPALREMSEYYGLKVEKMKGSGFYPFSHLKANVASKIFPKFSVYLVMKVRKKKN